MERDDKLRVSLERAEELKGRIKEYTDVKDGIPLGLDLKEEMRARKSELMDYFKCSEEEWNDWHWQMRNSVNSVSILDELLELSPEEKADIEEAGKTNRWSISPYYLSLIEKDNPSCPVKLQSVPSINEVRDMQGIEDPMAEAYTTPAERITRRYPDRLIINVTNQCAMFCRHCQRRRNIGEVDTPAPKEQVQKSIDYIRENPEIRDVLLTGGDALMLSDERLEEVISQLRDIPSVEIIRLGSRTPVTLPQRITQDLCDMLEKYHPIYVNTHFNHPREITQESFEVCRKLAKAGIGIGNQAVLLKGVNNNQHVMKKMNQGLLRIHVRPYYIFHAKEVKGTTHFATNVEEGIEIMEHLRGYTSGMAIPTYIINAPGGNGKTPVLPQYLISFNKGYVLIRTWEGKVFKYPNNHDS